MISLEKWYFDTLQKFPKNVGDLGKFIVAKGFKKLPKVQKSPDLVTLRTVDNLLKMGHSRPLFLYFRLFNAQLTVTNVQYK